MSALPTVTTIPAWASSEESSQASSVSSSADPSAHSKQSESAPSSRLWPIGYIRMRWAEEWRKFRESRRRLMDRKDYRRTLWLLAVSTVVLSLVLTNVNPALVSFPVQAVTMILMIVSMSVPVLWFCGLGFATVGNIVFDNIPTVSDIASIMDMADGVGVERVGIISSLLHKKESFQEWVATRLRFWLLRMTMSSWRKARRAVGEAVHRIFKQGRGIDGVSSLLLAYMWFLIPIMILSTLGLFGFIGWLRPTIARLPILLVALGVSLLVFPLTIGLSHAPNGIAAGIWGGMAFAWLLVGYTYFFVEEREYVMVRRIFRFLAGRPDETA